MLLGISRPGPLDQSISRRSLPAPRRQVVCRRLLAGSALALGPILLWQSDGDDRHARASPPVNLTPMSLRAAPGAVPMQDTYRDNFGGEPHDDPHVPAASQSERLIAALAVLLLLGA